MQYVLCPLFIYVWCTWLWVILLSLLTSESHPNLQYVYIFLIILVHQICLKSNLTKICWASANANSHIKIFTEPEYIFEIDVQYTIWIGKKNISSDKQCLVKSVFFRWAYSIDRVRCPSVVVVVRRPHSLNIFSSETAWPIKIKFHMAPPWDGGTKVCSNGPGHMTKMAATPIKVKNLKKIFFSRTKRPITLKVVV